MYLNKYRCRLFLLVITSWHTLLAEGLNQHSAFDSYYNLSSADGRTLNARIEAFSLTDVSIVLANNSRYKVPYERFNQETQDMLHQLWAQELNTQLALDIFPLNGQLISDMPAHEWAQSAGIEQESKTSYDSSYRNYLEDTQSLGSQAYTVSAYAKAAKIAGDEEQHIKQISIIFANKGDSVKPIDTYPGMLQSTYDDLQDKLRKELIEKIKQAATPIEQQLKSWFGDPVRMPYGYGSQKEYLDRWDSKGYSFLLNIKRDELISLKIVPTSLLVEKNQVVQIDKQELVSRITTNDFGDVVLGDMPMVDQGPKGYCFPATCERMMRYLGLEADMYKWAMAGDTGVGSGTRAEDMIPKVSNYIVQRSNSKLQKVSFKNLEIDDISEWIDQGVPILWTMYSSGPYNEIAAQRTNERQSLGQSPQEWAAKISSEAKSNAKRLSSLREGGHICMIIGYNAITNEIAVTDSWGESFALRWVHLDEISAVTWDDYTAYVGFPE